MYEALSALGSVVLDPYLLFLIFATTIIGIVIGAVSYTHLTLPTIYSV